MKRVHLFLFMAMVTLISLFTACSEEPIANDTVTDKDGNVYQTITIGTQIWMVENLKTTTYNDGTAIPYVTDGTAWSNLSTPAYCWYNSDATTNKDTYGALYNWYAINSGKLAPTGWHVATDEEWTTLQNYVNTHLGLSGTIAKALAATIKWTASIAEGAIGKDLTINDSSGFSALPGGFRYDNSGAFLDIGDYGYWWSSTENSGSSAWIRHMNYDSSDVSRIDKGKQSGFSVRCIMD